MRTLSSLVESFDSNPGNMMGVTNHLTPIFNIISNVRNLFGMRFGLAVEPGEDNVSIKLHSSKFINQDEINKVLDEIVYSTNPNGMSLRQYIISQGLTVVKAVNLGMYYVVYFSPNDIRMAENPDALTCPEGDAETTCSEMLKFNIHECEIERIVLEGTDDEELEDKSIQEMIDIIKSDDKIKAATKLADIVAKEVELPKEYYFKAVKDGDNHESIALRYKSQQRRPFGKTIDVVTSLMNIYGTGDEAVWVGAFDGECAPEVKKLIETILNLIRAKKTNDACVWKISDNPNDDNDDRTESENSNDEGNANDTKETTNEPNDGDDKIDISGALVDKE